MERTVKKCNRCGYEWFSKLDEPKRCTKCKSPYWNKPRIRLLENQHVVTSIAKRLAEA
jgi:predicted Zn-ribbon and HTH transcriptional regulator